MSEDNCYWTGEVGAFELCAEAFLPPLPEYWVRWDSETGLIGSPAIRTAKTGQWYGDGRAAQSVKVAASSGENGVIVLAVNYPFGDFTNNYSRQTYCVQRSTDYGFTYSDAIEYRTWQQGSAGGGYDAANGNWNDTYYHQGTPIDYDYANERFVVVSEIGNNEGFSPTNPYSTIVTAVSTDGASWTTNTVLNTKYNVMRCATYGGKIWYIDNNDWEDLFGTEGYYYGINYSANDGASWSHTALGSNNDLVTNRNNPEEVYTSLSANSTGCHILAEIYKLQAPNQDDWGNYYWRPTGDNTWAAPIKLWDHDNVFPSAPTHQASDYTCEIVASRIDPNLIMSIKMSTDWDDIWLKRSTDGGQIWSTEQQVIQLNYNGGSDPAENFRWNQAANMFQLLELDDGRWVITWVMEAYYGNPYETDPTVFDNYPGWVCYSVSEDAGLSWSQITLVSPFWTMDPVYYGERFEACARGVDVVVAMTNRSEGSYCLIFRPTSTPDAENLRPPTMTLPTPPTRGWP